MTTARERAVKSRQGAGKPWWFPTPKWWTLLVTSVVIVLAELIRSGDWNDVERGMTATALLGLATTWAKSNEGRGG